MAEPIRYDLTPDLEQRLGELELANVRLVAENRALKQRLAEMESETPAVDEKKNGRAKPSEVAAGEA